MSDQQNGTGGPARPAHPPDDDPTATRLRHGLDELTASVRDEPPGLDAPVAPHTAPETATPRHRWIAAAAAAIIVVAAGAGAVLMVSGDNGEAPSRSQSSDPPAGSSAPERASTDQRIDLAPHGLVTGQHSGQGGLLALTGGVVTVFDGCVHLSDRPNGLPRGETMYVWPRGSTWNAEQASIEVPDGPSIPVGAGISAGGGHVDLEQIDVDDYPGLADCMPDDTWSVWPLNDITVVAMPEEIPTMFRHDPRAPTDLSGRVARGELIVADGCLALDLDDGRRIVPIWTDEANWDFFYGGVLFPDDVGVPAETPVQVVVGTATVSRDQSDEWDACRTSIGATDDSHLVALATPADAPGTRGPPDGEADDETSLDRPVEDTGQVLDLGYVDFHETTMWSDHPESYAGISFDHDERTATVHYKAGTDTSWLDDILAESAGRSYEQDWTVSEDDDGRAEDPLPPATPYRILTKSERYSRADLEEERKAFVETELGRYVYGYGILAEENQMRIRLLDATEDGMSIADVYAADAAWPNLAIEVSPGMTDFSLRF